LVESGAGTEATDDESSVGYFLFPNVIPPAAAAAVLIPGFESSGFESPH